MRYALQKYPSLNHLNIYNDILFLDITQRKRHLASPSVLSRFY
nr:MAG TPA: hypothetical protein [Caudoviricetes sp.]